jgi:sphinganine-1-phosphate aldolase
MMDSIRSQRSRTSATDASIRNLESEHLAEMNMQSVKALVVARPLLTLAVTNALTAFSAFFIYARSNGGVKRTLGRILFSTLQALPGAAAAVAKEQQKVVDSLVESITKSRTGPRRNELPTSGMTHKEIIAQLEEWSSHERQWRNGKVSGTVYHGGDDLTELIVAAYKLYALSNPLHTDVFPSVVRMEAEIVRMTTTLFAGDADACGLLTSGGTESILLAMKCYRDFARETKGEFVC